MKRNELEHIIWCAINQDMTYEYDGFIYSACEELGKKYFILYDKEYGDYSKYCYYDGKKSLQSWEIVELVEKEWDIRSLTSNKQLANLLDFLQGNADRTVKQVSALFKSGCREVWI